MLLWKKWKDSRDLNEDKATLIDWQAMEKAMKAVPLSCKIFVVKHVSDQEAMGVEMKRRKERDFDHCP